MEEPLNTVAAIMDVVQGFVEGELTADQGMEQIHDLIVELCINTLPEGVTKGEVKDPDMPASLHTAIVKALAKKQAREALDGLDPR